MEIKTGWEWGILITMGKNSDTRAAVTLLQKEAQVCVSHSVLIRSTTSSFRSPEKPGTLVNQLEDFNHTENEISLESFC